ncbi:MAG: hypothetical protein ACHREM_07415 [Polyangiales bacterium]
MRPLQHALATSCATIAIAGCSGSPSAASTDGGAVVGATANDSGRDDATTIDVGQVGDAFNDVVAEVDAAETPGTCTPTTTFGGGETERSGGFLATAKIVDEAGAPVVGQPVFICGIDICSAPSVTSASGTVSISSTLPMKKPALKFGDSLSYAELAIPLTTATTDFTAGGTAVLTTAKLAGKPGAALTAGGAAISGDVTIAVPSGASVGIDLLVYATADEQLLRAINIPVASDGPILASSGVTGFQLLYGLAPAETPVCPAATVTVALPHAHQSPNDFGWTAGTKVEFWIMTIDTGQTYAPYAGWAKMSDGTVSADATAVSTDPGQGFDFLESFAIRLK